MTRLFVAVVGATLLSGMAPQAHHSYADFDLQRTVSVEGTLSQVLYANPHVMLTITTPDRASFTAEWANVRALEGGGVTEGTLNIGDRVIVSGNPARDPANRKLARLSEVRRPADGWQWVRGQGAVTPAAR
jgi:hypothetical protein